MNTTQELDEETCRWITGSTLADLVGKRVPYHFATGLIVWPIRSIEAHPELEIGDVVSIETTRFVGRSPLSDEEVRGRVSANAIVVGVNDPWGRDLDLWVPSFDKIVPATGTVTRKKFVPKPGTVLHTTVTEVSHTGDTTATDLLTVTVPPLFQGGLHAVRAVAVFSSSGAGGTKDVSVLYAGSGRTVTLASGSQIQRIDITIAAIGADTLGVTFNHPELAGFTGLVSSPFDVNVEQDITFVVDLANAGDAAALQMAEITWLGVAA